MSMLGVSSVCLVGYISLHWFGACPHSRMHFLILCGIFRCQVFFCIKANYFCFLFLLPMAFVVCEEEMVSACGDTLVSDVRLVCRLGAYPVDNCEQKEKRHG